MHTGLSAGAFATPPRNLSRPSRKRAQNAFRPARRPRPIGTDANITSGDVKHHLFLCQHHRAKSHYHLGHSRSRLRAQTITHLTNKHLSLTPPSAARENGGFTPSRVGRARAKRRVVGPPLPAVSRDSRSTRRLVAPRAHDPHRTHAQDSGFTFSNGLTVHFQSGFAHRHQVHASSTSPSRAARH